MIGERELVGLLHRADWTELTLSGVVRGAEQVVDTLIVARSGEPLNPPWGRGDDGLFLPPWLSRAWRAWGGRSSWPRWTFEPDSEKVGCTVSVAPGRRFRAESGTGAWAVGSDGERPWYWFRDRPAGVFPGFVRWPRPPYPTLLEPSWLLTEYSLVLDGEETVAGRAGVRVRGTLRTVAARKPTFGGWVGRGIAAGGLFTPVPRWMRDTRRDEVEAVVDAELGILLRCTRWRDEGTPHVTEFLSLDAAAAAAASAFSAPAGSVFGGDANAWTPGQGDRSADAAAGRSLGDAVGEALAAAGKEAAKTVAGLAAGGLGALIRYAPARHRVDPFARATTEVADLEAAMPTDEAAPDGPGDAAAEGVVPDEVLHLVYRSGLVAAPFSATLHEWFDGDAALAAIPQPARNTGFGGTGFLLDAVSDRAREAAAEAGHGVSTVRMGGWSEYRIDVVRAGANVVLFGSGREPDRPRTIASDGVRQWQVFTDRVIIGDAMIPPDVLADLLDASWLLGRDLELSGGTEVWLGERRAYRIVARYREHSLSELGVLERLFFPAVAVVDGETGRVLRLTRFMGGRPTSRQELRDVVELDVGGDFGYTPPAGLPIQE